MWWQLILILFLSLLISSKNDVWSLDSEKLSSLLSRSSEKKKTSKNSNHQKKDWKNVLTELRPYWCPIWSPKGSKIAWDFGIKVFTREDFAYCCPMFVVWDLWYGIPLTVFVSVSFNNSNVCLSRWVWSVPSIPLARRKRAWASWSRSTECRSRVYREYASAPCVKAPCVLDNINICFDDAVEQANHRDSENTWTKWNMFNTSLLVRIRKIILNRDVGIGKNTSRHWEEKECGKKKK